VRLEEVATINTGLVTARKQAKLPNEKGIPYKVLNLKAINAKGYIEDKLIEEFNANEKIKHVYLTQKDDIVVRLTTPFTAVLIDEMHLDLVIPSHFVVIRAERAKILPEYLYWLLNTDEVRQELQQNINSTMIGTVKPMSYASLEIDLIPTEAQVQISELYGVSKKELYLLDRLIGQKELYYKEAIKRIQKGMREK